jgi:hypothetical protein
MSGKATSTAHLRDGSPLTDALPVLRHRMMRQWRGFATLTPQHSVQRVRRVAPTQRSVQRAAQLPARSLPDNRAV